MRSPALLVALLVALTAPLLGSCAQQESGGLESVQARGVLRWGADLQGGEPYVFEDPDRPGHITGFEAEIAEALGKQLGVRTELVQNDWSTLVPSLERGSFDVIMNGLEITESRKQRVLFSRPYHLFAEQLVAREGDSRVRDLSSLRGLRVGTLASSLAWDMLQPTGAIVVPYEGVEEPYIDLQQGRTDAVLLDDIVVERYGRKPGLRTVDDAGIGTYAIAARKDDAGLIAAIDEALDRLRASGELAAILARWKLVAPPGAEAAWAAIEAKAAGAEPAKAGFRLSGHQVSLFLQGAAITLAVSACAMALAVVLGLLLAIARLPSPLWHRRALGRVAAAYVEVYRGTPVLLQLYVLYYGLAPVFALDAFAAAVIGLGMNYAAYEAEIYRGGVAAVPVGEVEAAHALGMSEWLALRRVVLPQAIRFSLPGVTNDFIALLKDSSLVSVPVSLPSGSATITTWWSTTPRAREARRGSGGCSGCLATTGCRCSTADCRNGSQKAGRWNPVHPRRHRQASPRAGTTPWCAASSRFWKTWTHRGSRCSMPGLRAGSPPPNPSLARACVAGTFPGASTDHSSICMTVKRGP
jgi:polar amino acid transport system substrate-binding protein